MPVIDFKIFPTSFSVRRGLCQLSVTIDDRVYAVEMPIPENRPLSASRDAAPLFAMLAGHLSSGN